MGKKKKKENACVFFLFRFASDQLQNPLHTGQVRCFSCQALIDRTTIKVYVAAQAGVVPAAQTTDGYRTCVRVLDGYARAAELRLQEVATVEQYAFQRVVTFRRQLKKEKARHTRTQRRVDQLEDELEDLDVKYVNEKTKVRDLEAQLAQLREEKIQDVARATARASSFEGRNEELEKEVDQARKDREWYEISVNLYKAQIRNLVAELRNTIH